MHMSVQTLRNKMATLGVIPSHSDSYPPANPVPDPTMLATACYQELYGGGRVTVRAGTISLHTNASQILIILPSYKLHVYFFAQKLLNFKSTEASSAASDLNSFL